VGREQVDKSVPEVRSKPRKCRCTATWCPLVCLVHGTSQVGGGRSAAVHGEGSRLGSLFHCRTAPDPALVYTTLPRLRAVTCTVNSIECVPFGGQNVLNFRNKIPQSNQK